MSWLSAGHPHMGSVFIFICHIQWAQPLLLCQPAVGQHLTINDYVDINTDKKDSWPSGTHLGNVAYFTTVVLSLMTCEAWKLIIKKQTRESGSKTTNWRTWSPNSQEANDVKYSPTTCFSSAFNSYALTLACCLEAFQRRGWRDEWQLEAFFKATKLLQNSTGQINMKQVSTWIQ